MSQSVFTTVSDVQAALNATYDQTSQVYGVYGLNMAASSFQAHVAFANNYVNSILGSSLTSRFVAKDVACIRILVVSMGARYWFGLKVRFYR